MVNSGPALASGPLRAPRRSPVRQRGLRAGGSRLEPALGIGDHNGRREPRSRERDPNLQVKVSDMQRTSTATLMRWEVPSWVLWVVMGGLVLTLWLIVYGPEPWRATRWGWAWATLLTGPVGAMAFALLSGPVTRLHAPKANGRRLTGGWSFILMVLLKLHDDAGGLGLRLPLPPPQCPPRCSDCDMRPFAASQASNRVGWRSSLVIPTGRAERCRRGSGGDGRLGWC